MSQAVNENPTIEEQTAHYRRQTFFLDRDNDAHWYLVDNAIRDQWFAWLDLPGDDERSWTPPAGAERLSGPPSMIIFHLADETNN